jgi:hypothetical protein
MTWQAIGDWAFYALAGVTVLFSLLYLVLAPWWKTVTGRNIMTVMGSLAFALGYFTWVILRDGVPEYFWPMRAFLFATLAASIGWRIVIFIRHHLVRSLRPEKERKNVENAR